MKEYKIKINGNEYNVVVNDVEETTAKVEVNGTSYDVEFEQPVAKPKAAVSKPVAKAAAPAPAAAAAAPAAAPKAAAPAGGTTVNSPLPGVVLSVNCKEGQAVKKGDCLIVLEAMKMENSIEATCDGTVKSIMVQKGDSVLEGAALVTIG